MSISGIQSGISTLISAVSPVAPVAATPAPTAAPTGTPDKGNPSFFALSVLAQVLESQETLLDGKDHTQDGQNVVNAAASATAVQQAAMAYSAAQGIAVTASEPLVNITA